MLNPKEPFMAQDTTSELDALRDACGANPKLVCEWVFERTDNETAAALVDWLVDRPLRILVIIVIAWIVSRVLSNLVTRFADQLAERNSAPLEPAPADPQVADGDDAAPKKPRERLGVESAMRRRAHRLAERREQQVRARQRALTLGAMLRSIVGLVVWTTAGFMVMAELGISLGPLIASAGIAGIAIGFGAQSIVRDFLAGVFVIIEDQYGVGDVIDTGEATGTVESVGFRTTQIRDVSGVLWTVPNGVIQRVGNYSQVWSKSIFDMEVAYDTDLDHAMVVMKRVLDEVWHEQREEATIIEEPEVQGVQSFGASSIVIRAAVKTDPSEQWATGRYVRRKLKIAFDEEGIEIPFTQHVVWLKNEEDGAVPETTTT
ncbi:MAG: mechanosensitive ion channel family protein [Acidimicrobiales bacterium]